MIRILTSEFPPRTGGISTYCLEIAKALHAAGENIVVQCPLTAASPPVVPFEIQAFRGRGTQDPDDLLRIQSLVRTHLKTTPDDILFFPEPATIRAVLVFQHILPFGNTPVWIAFHGSEFLQLQANPVWRSLLRRFLKKVSKVVVNSDYTRNLVSRKIGNIDDRTVAIKPCLPDGWGQSLDRASRTHRDTVRLLTVARLHPRKGQLEVVKSLVQLATRKTQMVDYQIVGESRRPRYRKQLETAAEHCPYHVDICGPLFGDAYFEAYRNADIFVLAGHQHKNSVEGFGIVFLEAAAAGLPVIAADVGGVREAVIPGETALLIPPSNPEALLEAIERLVSNPDLRRRMGEAGKAFATSKSWIKAVRPLLGDR